MKRSVGLLNSSKSNTTALLLDMLMKGHVKRGSHRYFASQSSKKRQLIVRQEWTHHCTVSQPWDVLSVDKDNFVAHFAKNSGIVNSQSISVSQNTVSPLKYGMRNQVLTNASRANPAHRSVDHSCGAVFLFHIFRIPALAVVFRIVHPWHESV